MVIAEKFAWAHLPKTAGDATCAMFLSVPGLVRSADPPTSEDKHLPFFAREPEVAGKLLVMNIRRLPAWVLSAAQHAAKHGTAPNYRPRPLATAGQMSKQTDPDDLLRWMTDHGRFAIGRWLRAERLEEDVLALLGELGDVTEEVRGRVRVIGLVNTNEYDHELGNWFTGEQIIELYARNPDWAAIELQVYGELLGGAEGVDARS